MASCPIHTCAQSWVFVTTPGSRAQPILRRQMFASLAHELVRLLWLGHVFSSEFVDYTSASDPQAQSLPREEIWSNACGGGLCWYVLAILSPRIGTTASLYPMRLSQPCVKRIVSTVSTMSRSAATSRHALAGMHLLCQGLVRRQAQTGEGHSRRAVSAARSPDHITLAATRHVDMLAISMSAHWQTRTASTGTRVPACSGSARTEYVQIEPWHWKSGWWTDQLPARRELSLLQATNLHYGIIEFWTKRFGRSSTAKSAEQCRENHRRAFTRTSDEARRWSGRTSRNGRRNARKGFFLEPDDAVNRFVPPYGRARAMASELPWRFRSATCHRTHFLSIVDLLDYVTKTADT